MFIATGMLPISLKLAINTMAEEENKSLVMEVKPVLDTIDEIVKKMREAKFEGVPREMEHSIKKMVIKNFRQIKRIITEEGYKQKKEAKDAG